MGICKYLSEDHMSYKYEGWFIKFHTPSTKNNMYDGEFDIEKTKNSTSHSCFCGSDYRNWEIISEWEMKKYPDTYLFNTKMEALERFNKLVKAYGRGLKFDDIFVSIHHCEIEYTFKCD